jgi:hypothetical protein
MKYRVLGPVGISDPGALLAWLPKGLHEPVAELLHHRKRIPQETLGLRALRADPALLRQTVG